MKVTFPVVFKMKVSHILKTEVFELALSFGEKIILYGFDRGANFLFKGSLKKSSPSIIPLFYILLRELSFFTGMGGASVCVCKGGADFFGVVKGGDQNFFSQSQRGNQNFFPSAKGRPEFFYVCKGGGDPPSQTDGPPPLKNDSSIILKLWHFEIWAIQPVNSQETFWVLNIGEM